ncbi:MAG: hypothetical protein RL223_3060 [Pseudomonadota bacterium]|jgi:predicted DNA-binding transcriptional regulator AlpA
MTNMKHQGPASAGKAHPHSPAKVLPEALAAVALVDAKTAAAAGCMSVSWWHERVSAGEAPQPVMRSHRCTRWAATAVADFWRDFAGARHDAAAGAAVLRRATVASAAGKAKRAAIQLQKEA